MLFLTPDIAAAGNRGPGVPPDPGAAGLAGRGPAVRSSAKVPNFAAEGRRHISDYDFVAGDHTTHFDLHARPGAIIPAPGARCGVPNRLVRKRVVVN